MADFAGRKALVTGAASGIGLATARALATAGVSRLILTDIDADALARAYGELGEIVEAVPGDVTDEALWRELAPELAGLDLAVVNAGIATSGAIVDCTLADWRRVMAVNLDGAFLTLKAAMAAMQGRAGSIVVVASAAGVKAEPGIAAYAASKAGAIQLARVAAKEGAAQGLRVNAIAPGGVETPIWQAVPFFRDMAEKDGEAAAFAAMARMATPLGRFATADEIAGQIAFLLSDAAATITGSVLNSDGGYSL